MSSPKKSAAGHVSDGTTEMWIGAATMLVLTAGTLYLLSYLLLDLSWQARWGAWNYLIGTVITVGAIIPLRMWRPYSGAHVGTAAAESSDFDTSQVESPL